MFNENEEEIVAMLRKTYVNDDKTSNLEKVKAQDTQLTKCRNLNELFTK